MLGTMTDLYEPDGDHDKALQLDFLPEWDGGDPETVPEDEYDDAWASACTPEEAKKFLDDLAAGN